MKIAYIFIPNFFKIAVLSVLFGVISSGAIMGATIKAATSKVDISPRTLPAIRNGGFLQAVAQRIDDTLYSRCVVISNGTEKIAIVVVDSCMVPTALCDSIKTQISERTEIPHDRILISATHTHSAPSVMSFCLGTSRDEAYTKVFTNRVIEGVIEASSNLVPVDVGWGKIDAPGYTNNRRWITRRDKMLVDPFGDLSVRAMMHPGYLNPDYVSESGPTDKELTLFALKDKKSGELLCVFGNYSMHYFSGNPGFSADYFGEVAQIVEEKIIKEGTGIESDFLAILSQGTSGDLYWVDYSKPKISQSRTEYSMGLSKKIFGLLNTLKYHSDIPFGMTERRIRISRRLPDKKRLDWAKKLNQLRGDITPRNRPEVYAQASQWINNNPESEVVLQTIRMGDFIMTAMPNEVYAITGLKLKKQSPAKVTMNVELSNGAEGYIPPPEQHLLGGYTTWPARTAALKESAEPVIVENLLEMIEKLTGQKRKSNILKTSKFRSTILSKKPIAYWPLDDLSVTETMDLTENHTSKYQGSVALHLNGIKRNGLDDSNKCVYFAGGSFVSELKNPLEEFSISLFFWSANAPIPKGHEDTLVELISNDISTKIILEPGDGLLSSLKVKSDRTSRSGIYKSSARNWHNLTIEYGGDHIQIYVNGELDIDSRLAKGSKPITHILFGAFDGKLDEVT